MGVRIAPVYAEQSLAILFIDLDGFKGINDTLGHEVGDRVLSMAALRVKNFSTDSQLVCRWGGDEFLVVLSHEGHQQTSTFAKGLIEKMSEPYVDGTYRVTIGATIGISIYPEHSQSKEELIQHADMAMYQQKRQAKGSVGYFNETLRLQLQREFNLRDQLITAAEKDELNLVYQPIVNAKTGKVEAFEALLRWNSALGLIMPDQFIAIAGQYGQIKNIGLWVLERACQQAKVFQQRSPEIAICVNVSVVQFQDEDFIEQISNVFQKHDFEPSGLHIEITESFFASDKLGLMKQIKALQEMDIQISIDDFGTGYSSLSSMQDMGVDIVKIDKSFVDTIQGSGLSIITAVLHIANELNYQVVAEGVETEEQAKILRDLNVDYLQGYYFSRPMESEQALEYLESQAS
ncbi:putative bifunctional diguanylate cyclase/phosphodiesterase [Marinomonas sp.]|uniref:putative bifunctional diguanylate cyclase/phosphodiesterase n=1 Tax=Marinomonas sp. TaxID=1904862 RepID=UPI003BAB593B